MASCGVGFRALVVMENKLMPKKLYNWEILVLKANAKRIGTVEAADQKSAIQKAIKELEISENEQKRLMAVRSGR